MESGINLPNPICDYSVCRPTGIFGVLRLASVAPRGGFSVSGPVVGRPPPPGRKGGPFHTHWGGPPLHYLPRCYRDGFFHLSRRLAKCGEPFFAACERSQITTLKGRPPKPSSFIRA